MIVVGKGYIIVFSFSALYTAQLKFERRRKSPTRGGMHPNKKRFGLVQTQGRIATTLPPQILI